MHTTFTYNMTLLRPNSLNDLLKHYYYTKKTVFMQSKTTVFVLKQVFESPWLSRSLNTQMDENTMRLSVDLASKAADLQSSWKGRLRHHWTHHPSCRRWVWPLVDLFEPACSCVVWARWRHFHARGHPSAAAPGSTCPRGRKLFHPRFEHFLGWAKEHLFGPQSDR